MLTNRLIVSVIEHASNYGYYVLTHIIHDAKDTEAARASRKFFIRAGSTGGSLSARRTASRSSKVVAKASGRRRGPAAGQSETNRIVSNFNNDSGMKQAVAYSPVSGIPNRIINGDMNRLSGKTKYEGLPQWHAHVRLAASTRIGCCTAIFTRERL